MYQVNCLHPRIIIHPSYIESVLKSSYLVTPINISESVSDSVHEISPEERALIFKGESPYKVFRLPYPKNVNPSSLDSFSFVDYSGVSYPVYIPVACGHCSACQSKKYSSIVQRMLFAAESSSFTKPLFLTLTYNDAHLPSDGVSRRDVQLFIKRFRKHCKTFLNLDNLKFSYFSEYGSKNGRPHYHMIIYNYPFDLLKPLESYKLLSSYISYCWRDPDRTSFEKYSSSSSVDEKSSYGFINLNITSHSRVFAYVSKYVAKGSEIPKGKNPNFYSLSKNLGLDLLEGKKQYILQDPRRCFRYLSGLDNSVHEVYLCSYFINKLFPSSSVFMRDCKKKFMSLYFSYNQLFNNKNLPLWYRNSINTLFYNVLDKFPFLNFFNSTSLSRLQSENVDYSDYMSFVHESDPYYIDKVNFDDLSDSFVHLRYSVFEPGNQFLSDLCYFEDLDPSINKIIADAIFDRDKFLSGLNFNTEPVIKSLDFKSRINSLISRSKI